LKKQNKFNKLAFNKAIVTELTNRESMEIVGGSEDMPVPTVIQVLTKINWTAFI
jgi:hypothetical protein